MREHWRLLKTNNLSAYTNMAIDRAVLSAISKGMAPPTVRFYTWSPPAISIGYFQSIKEEVDLEKCKNLGVDYVRRITGGGAVFHEHEITYSIIIKESNKKIPKNILESYSKICGALINGLKKIGIDSKYSPINDILVQGRKISGNAQTRKEKTVLQHGTILLDVDVEKMFSLLKVPNEKIKDKMISDVKQRVTSVKDILGNKVKIMEVSESLKFGFEEEFDVDIIDGKLSSEELELTKKFETECFSSVEWTFKR